MSLLGKSIVVWLTSILHIVTIAKKNMKPRVIIFILISLLDTYHILRASGQEDTQDAETRRKAFNFIYNLEQSEPYYTNIYDLRAEFEKAHELFTRNNWPDPENYIELSHRWYDLIVKLYDKWSSSEIQDNRGTHEASLLAQACRDLGAANLETGHIIYVQQLDPDILDDPDYQYILNHEITPMKSKALCDLFEVTLKWPRYNMTNPTPDSLRIYGDFVVSGDIALLYETGHKHINTVEIFALNKFIVDYDLSFNSETPFTMFVTAPMWDVFTADEIRVKPQQGANWEPSFHIGSSSSGSSFFGIGMKFRQMADRLELAIEPQPSTSEYISLYQLVPPEELQVPRSAYGSALTNPNPSADINYDYHATMNEYEKYLLEYRNDLFRYTVLTKYFTKIYTYPNFKPSLFNTVGFAKELGILEDHFLTLYRDDIHMAAIYHTLDGRFRNYAVSPKANENERIHIEMRKYISTAIWSKKYILSSDDDLVLDLVEYVGISLNDTISLGDVIQRQNSKKIMMYNKDMKDTILEEIVRINDYIAQQVMPQMASTNIQLDDQLKQILEKIIRLKEDTQKNIREREKELKQLNQFKHIKRFYSVLACIGGALLALGTMGGGGFIFIGGYTMVASTLVNSIDDPEVTEKLKMPAAMDNVQNYLNTRKQSLDSFLQILDDHEPSLLGDLKGKIEETRQELMKAVDNAPFEQVEDALLMKEKELNAMSPKPSAALDIIQELKKRLRVAQDSSADMYLKYYRNDTALQILKDSANENDPEEILKINQYERNVHGLLVPAIKFLMNYTMSVTNMTDSQSLADIDMKKFKANNMLEDIRFRVSGFTEGFYEGKMMLNLIDKLSRALNLVFGLLSRIAAYFENIELVNYIANLNAVQFETESNGDSAMMDIIDNLKYISRYNTVIGQYKRIINSYKLFAFPFTSMVSAVDNFDLYTERDEMPSMRDIAFNAELQLNYLTLKMNDYKNDVIRREDVDVMEGRFDGSSPRQPVFFSWNVRHAADTLEKLFNGEKVKLFADVKESPNRNAIKFNKIGIRFKSNKPKGQAQIDDALKPYNVRMTHSGESNYRCGEHFYKVQSANVTFVYSYEKYASGEPVKTEDTYKKLVRSSPLLSPYTEWTINLEIESNSFSALHTLKAKRMDIELVGYGQYVSGSLVCDQNLHMYYEKLD